MIKKSCQRIHSPSLSINFGKTCRQEFTYALAMVSMKATTFWINLLRQAGCLEVILEVVFEKI